VKSPLHLPPPPLPTGQAGVGVRKIQEEQESFIKLRTPEPDDFNPYEDAPLSAGKQWKKACEWWDEDVLRN